MAEQILASRMTDPLKSARSLNDDVAAASDGVGNVSHSVAIRVHDGSVPHPATRGQDRVSPALTSRTGFFGGTGTPYGLTAWTTAWIAAAGRAWTSSGRSRCRRGLSRRHQRRRTGHCGQVLRELPDHLLWEVGLNLDKVYGEFLAGGAAGLPEACPV